MTYIDKEMSEEEVATVMKKFSNMIAKEKRDYVDITDKVL